MGTIASKPKWRGEVFRKEVMQYHMDEDATRYFDNIFSSFVNYDSFVAHHVIFQRSRRSGEFVNLMCDVVNDVSDLIVVEISCRDVRNPITYLFYRLPSNLQRDVRETLKWWDADIRGGQLFELYSVMEAVLKSSRRQMLVFVRDFHKLFVDVPDTPYSTCVLEQIRHMGASSGSSIQLMLCCEGGGQIEQLVYGKKGGTSGVDENIFQPYSL